MDFILQFFFIILSIIVIPLGLLGGRWLWRKMAQSPLLLHMQKYIRPIGVFGTIAMFGSACACVIAVDVLPSLTLVDVARPLSICAGFLLAYLVGYDISLFKNMTPLNMVHAPSPSLESPQSFRIRWDLVKKVYLKIILVIFIPDQILGLVSVISWDVSIDILFMAVGGSLGYLFWEHLKDTGILVGSLLKHLLILSIATTGVMMYIFAYSVFVIMCPCDPVRAQILFLSLAVFMECMGWYMLSIPLTRRQLNPTTRV